MKVRFIFCAWFTIFGCLLCVAAGQPSPTDSPRECETWTRLTQRINEYHSRQNNGDVNSIACKDHSKDKCEQLDCGGTYNLDFIQMKFDVCLGIIFHHCDLTPSIAVSLQIPDFNVSINRKVVHNDTIPVPGLSRNIGRNKAEIVLFVELERWNTTNFLFKMSGRVRFTTSVFGRTITEWPEGLQQDIITLDIPVTNCTTRTNVTLPKLNTCDVQKYIGKHTIKPVVTTTPPPIKITSVTYNKTCIHGSMKGSQCSRNETCINSRCLCGYDYKLSPRGVCEFVGKPGRRPILNIPIDDIKPAKPGIPHTASQQQSSSSGGLNKTMLGMIIGGAVGGLVALVAVIVVVIIKKRRSRYQGRELLLTEDDTDGAI